MPIDMSKTPCRAIGPYRGKCVDGRVQTENPAITRECSWCGGAGFSRLTPGKWFSNDEGEIWSDAGDVHIFVASFDDPGSKRADPAFEAKVMTLLKNVMDVMERRQWSIHRELRGWRFVAEDASGFWSRLRLTLPALYEAMIAEDERLTGESHNA